MTITGLIIALGIGCAAAFGAAAFGPGSGVVARLRLSRRVRRFRKTHGRDPTAEELNLSPRDWTLLKNGPSFPADVGGT